MSNKVEHHKKLLIAAVISGIILGIISTYVLMANTSIKPQKTPQTAAQQPLYWVAPMDANYKRDKPGKSPMGMDLVAVYATPDTAASTASGAIRISPEVVNNLGVRTVIAQEKRLDNNINTVGYIRYNADEIVHIHPRVSGWIEKLHVKTLGAKVLKGQPLFDLYSPELVNAQEEYLLAINSHNSRLIQAAENRLTALQIGKPTMASLRKNGKVKQNVTFYAPQNGVLETVNINEGFFVKPELTLMSIADLSSVWVEAEVFARQAAHVEIGAKVTMRLDYLPAKTYHGQVDFIYPILDTQTRTVKVRIRLANQAGHLKPNMFAQVSIASRKQSAKVVIPQDALIRTGTQDRVVLALGEGRFKSVAVTVGRFDSDSVEILTGLAAGERVVSSGQFLLDSESSKSSDFKRFHHEHAEKTTSTSNNMAVMHTPTQVSSAQTTGTVNAIMVKEYKINISRAAIEKWQRPPATLDFLIEPTLDISSLTQGDVIAFTFEIRNDDFVMVDFSKQAAKGQE